MRHFLSFRRWFDRLFNGRRHAGKPRCIMSRVLPSKQRIRPRLESLEERLAPAIVSDGGTSVLTIAMGATSEILSIVSNGSSYTFTDLPTIFGKSSNVDPANQNAFFSGLGTGTLTLTSAGISHYTTIKITDQRPNASVTFNDSGSNAYANNFDVELGNASAGAVTFVGKSNFGTFNLKASSTYQIEMTTGSSLTSSSGNLTLVAHQQESVQVLYGAAVLIWGASIACTGSGLINIDGQWENKTAAPNAYEKGVSVQVGSMISGGTGDVTITGTGGAGSSLDIGVNVWGNSVVTSNGGNVTLTGTGGGSGIAGSVTAGFDQGIAIDGTSRVSAGGMGNIKVVGTGGPNEGVSDYGILVDRPGGAISSSGGNVFVAGQGGGTGASYGIALVQGAEITAAGTGNVTVQATGGSGTRQNAGLLSEGSIISQGGNVVISGQGGSSGDLNIGVWLDVASSVTAGGSGTVTVNGTGGLTSGGADYGVYITNTGPTISAANGNVQVIGTGGGLGSGGNNYGVFVDKSGKIRDF